MAKFWLRDLWGPEWDAHRRSLLFKHYRSYFRNPPIPGEYLPPPPLTESSEVIAEEAFSRVYRARIESVQGAKGAGAGVHLTYRPLGKNLRLLGTTLRKNVDLGRPTRIEAEGPPAERRALEARGHRWSPWVWVRSADGAPTGSEDAARAWNDLFQNPPAVEPGGAGSPGRGKGRGAPAFGPGSLPSLSSGIGPYSLAYRERVLKVAIATRYAFTPSAPILAEISALKQAARWPDPSRRVLGIHVRRGDAASADAAAKAPTKSTRKSFPLSEYLEAADRICERYGIENIFLATESREEIERAQALRPGYRFLWIDYDRTLFPNITTSNQFIEDLALDHPERARALALTAIFDLYFFCECQAFIGAFNSEFSVLGWLLMTGSRGHLVPHVSLSRAAEGRSINPFQALLNLQNNCPLELYHW